MNNIFSFLDRADNARNAQVCKTWCDIALKIIWAEADNLCALFSILAPSCVSTKEEGRKVQSFTRLPFVSDWRRFDKYATLVCKLKYNAADEPIISRAVLRDIAQTRIRLQIFPNLHTLEWKPRHPYTKHMPNLSDAILFMHEGVKALSIFLPGYAKKCHVEQLVFDVPLRMPRLTEITITSVIEVIGLEKYLCDLVSNLHALKKISIPSEYLTNRLTDALSLLPALSTIVAAFGDGDAALLDHAQLVIPLQRFSALKTFCVKAPLSVVTHFLKAGTSSSYLATLVVTSESGPASDIQQMLELCAEEYKELGCLELNFDRRITSVGNPLPRITFSALRPLGDWSNSSLTDLCILHPVTLGLSLEELTSIVSAHPNLSKLVLNPSPVECEGSALGLDVLPLIAQHCKGLNELGLFLDATKPVPPRRIDAIQRTILFPKLVSCSFGVSVITKESCRVAAGYISTCLPSGCKIKYGAEWAKDDGGGPRIRIANARSKLWKEVEGLLQFVEVVRIQERT
ncbi:hypothetical protein D9619_013306 [Psilocybe cf. subviscida]|uniref:F-box domain-containing protein n=1 Tax=Psilocybe cf. subviscida TaxID=2480587 RepID=A0A8H5F959_9AGAR|nr:hypothetical protein D9619_013306 [Psilocybe cf. subviscida]